MARPLEAAAWRDVAEFPGLLDAVRRGGGDTEVAGLPTPAAVTLGLAARQELGRPLVFVVPDPATAQSVAEAAEAWLGTGAPVLPFPPREFLPYTVLAQSPEIHAPRLRALAALVSAPGPDGPPILVVPVSALRRQLPPPAVFAAALRELRVGAAGTPGELADHLVRCGYRREAVVEGPGAFAVRGGIVDVFALTADEPWRVEFDDERVASLRTFSAESQRSGEALQTVVVPPAREVPAPVPQDTPAAAEAVRGSLDGMLGRLGEPEAHARLQEQVSGDLEALLGGSDPGRWENYLPFSWEPSSVLHYLAGGPGSRGPICVVLDAALAAEAAAELARQDDARLGGFLADGRVLPEQAAAFALPRDWRSDLRGAAIFVNPLGRTVAGLGAAERLTVPGRHAPPFAGQWKLAVDEMRRWIGARQRVLCWVGSEERARGVLDEVRSAGLAAVQGVPQAMPGGQVAVVVGHLPAGFEVPGLSLAVLSEQELLGRRPRAARVRRAGAGARLQSYEDLRVGDFVVHATHGIGQYLGTAALTVQGKQRDYLVLRYEGTDRLYVPTEQVGLVSKYVGGEARQPRVSRLGGAEWSRAKQRVRESVRAMAEELIALYAARQTLHGHAFGADTPWQAEFEESFPFEETPDQLVAIGEIKADMERPVPMDRLLCGDVGYGKTEVAMRAAFKAVMDGRQVAVLVPTTILAEQHELTFTERFRGFPVTIRMLSRFRTKQEQDETVTGLRRGAVDIVIGTHRLLGEDVGWKNLGLVIIDEEHRFGVAHKERLKQLRQTVDVLAMTATPIPRTLHMAMAGIRDLSAITTPPDNRYPVETVVVEWSPALVREAVSRELARRGQVYYLHNRVRSIAEAHERLHGLVPEADVAVAHGRMPEEELESVMRSFWSGERQVLLSTTIIESGLDIPNANTLIVEDADRLGLAQLYQIRGRVGRSARVAYAYFTYRRERSLSEVAERRLEAIREFTELGSGFKIALRDLEIRGAGNLLGPEQHGFVTAVGFELYAQLLEEAVRELRGKREAPRTHASVELRVDAFIEDAYVAEPRVKLEFYRKVHGAATLDDVAAVEEELRDRFGPYPAGVAHLLRLARIRVLAEAVGLLGVVQEGRTVTLTFPNYAAPLLGRLRDVPAQVGRRLRLVAQPRPVGQLALDALDDATVLGGVEACLQALAANPQVRAWQRAAAEAPPEPEPAPAPPPARAAQPAPAASPPPPPPAPEAGPDEAADRLAARHGLRRLSPPAPAVEARPRTHVHGHAAAPAAGPPQPGRPLRPQAPRGLVLPGAPSGPQRRPRP